VATDIISNAVPATVVTGGGDAPSPGTSQSWSVNASGWTVLTAGQVMRVMDAVDVGKQTNYEIMEVTANANGTPASWTVTRGVESTTPHTHAANWTVVPVASSGGLDGRYQQVNIVTTTFSSNAYTLAITDAFTAQQASNSSTPAAITVPTNASVAFAIGTVITVTQTGSGKISITAAGGVTIISSVSGGFVSGTTGCRAQSSTIGLLKTATNAWTMSGDAG
jgi:hypothetical protein